MRHGDKINNLGRTYKHRHAMLSNMACSLIENKRIFTTLAKAKAMRVYIEPLITRSKEDTMHNRRIVFSYLQDKEAIKELFGTISDKVADRPGGYTRIIKMPRRQGDAADMAMLELVDFNEIYNPNAEEGAKKTRRSRRGGGGGSGTATAKTATATAASAAAAAQEDIAEETVSNETEEPTVQDEAEMPAPNDETPAEENGTANELPENQ